MKNAFARLGPAAAVFAAGHAFLTVAHAETGGAAVLPMAQAEIIVIGERNNLLEIPGSGSTIEAEDLERARVFTVNEALRQVAGVYPRDEEGLGIRPNIGVRGLSPTRSTKVLLLEDGLPLAYAPYGDNASYSHPPIRRFQRIEVLKGASQVRFGPNTVGGVVNYITPSAPEAFGGSAMAATGSDGYGELDLSVGGPLVGARALLHVNSTTFDGVRANHDLNFNDLYLKVERDIAPGQQATVRLGYATEDSQVSYSGLTEAEYRANPRANPFPNDVFEIERFTASATHAWAPSEALTLTTTAYALWFDRDWWRQSSNSGQRPADASDPRCGGMASLTTTCGNEGRLREYNHYGVESRLAWSGRLFGVEADVEAGLRHHTERQNRLQINSDTPRGRAPGTSVNAGVREANLRYADAWSGFVTGGFDLGRLKVSPGVRVESIDYERRDRLTGAGGETDLTEVVPGLGLIWELRDNFVIYGGAHRGFAPPRVEDVLSASGGAVDLDAEESVNWELGVRGHARPGLELDVAAFRMEFDNQIVPSSVAGGVGATQTNAGETRHSGLEASVRGSLRDAGLMDVDDVFFRAALTWVGEAEFAGRRLSAISPGVSVSGNRLPYAPEWVGSAALGYARGDWLVAQVEAQYTGEQFTDDLNTVAPSANGQRGLIADATVVNLAVNVTPTGSPATFFATVKNAFDETYIVDRARGIIPGAPRLLQAGVSIDF